MTTIRQILGIGTPGPRTGVIVPAPSVPERKQIDFTSSSIMLDGMLATEAIELLTNHAKASSPDARIRFSPEWDCDAGFSLVWTKPESDFDYNARLAAYDVDKENRRLAFLELRKEFPDEP